jgi:Protein of unknown function (DUF4435)
MLTRTSSGRKNFDLFFPSSYIVIVEGSTDKVFWSNLFPKEISNYVVKFKAVGGKREVEKYIENIVNDDAPYIAAQDSDYRQILNATFHHVRVVDTYYHSIENIMFCSCKIAKIIQTYSHEIDYPIENVDAWLVDFDVSIFPLMIADLMIDKAPNGLKGMGNNCFQFLISKRKAKFDSGKIASHISGLGLQEADLEELSIQLQHYLPRHHARGHFFTSSINIFINQEIKRVSGRNCTVSSDGLFAQASDLCQVCSTSNFHILSLISSAKKAAENLVIRLSK